MRLADRFPGSKPSASTSTVSDAIEELGAGPAQWLVVLITGAVHFLSGSLTMLVTSLSDAHALEWGLTPLQNGALVSAYFLGCLLGNVAGGLVGDHCGRKQPIVVGFWLTLIGCALASLARGFWTLAFLRLLMGFGSDVAQPPAQTMMSEVSPAAWRLFFSTVKCATFSLGGVWTAVLFTLDDPDILDVHWRLLTAGAALPAVALGSLGAAVFLNPSPLYLASTGRYEEAEEVVSDMRRQNCLPVVPVKLAPETTRRRTEVTVSRQMRTVFGPTLLSTTLALWYCLFIVDGLHFGAMGAFAKAMVRGVSLGGSPSVTLVLGAGVEVFGYVVPLLCARWPRKLLLLCAFAEEAVCLSAFALGARRAGQGWAAQLVAMLGFYGAKLGNPTCLVVSFVYVTEVYPTTTRSLGLALAMAAGRLGDCFTPSVLELVMSATSLDVFFWLSAGLHVVAACLVYLLPYETLGRVLPEDEGLETEGYGATAREPCNECSPRPPEVTV